MSPPFQLPLMPRTSSYVPPARKPIPKDTHLPVQVRDTAGCVAIKESAPDIGLKNARQMCPHLDKVESAPRITTDQ